MQPYLNPIQADQLLTSFTVLRNRGNPLPHAHPRAQNGTPPPLLEPIDGAYDSESLPSLQSIEDSDDDDDDTYNGMPDLDTVSESSEDECPSELSNDDGDEDSLHGDVNEEVQAMIRELSDALSRESFALGGDAPPISLEQPFLSYLENLRNLASPAQGEDEAMPDLEVIADSSESDPGSSDEELPQALMEPSPEPPFVTDGRGRVVWTSNGSQQQEQQTPSEPTQPTARAEPTVVEPSDPRPTEGPNTQQQRPKAASHQSHPRPRVAGPNAFTTDGRGRVVGTGSGSSADGQAHPQALGAIWSSSLSNTQGGTGQQRRLELDEVD